MSKIARPGSEGNMRLLSEYGGGSKPPRQSYADGGAVNPSLDEGLSAAGDGDRKDDGKDGKSKKSGKDSKINVNVIIQGKDKDAAPPMPPPTGAAGLAPPPMPPMPPPGPPMGMPPGGPMGGPPGMPPGMPMRAKGGRIPANFAKNVAEPVATNDKGKSAKKPIFDPPAPLAMPKGKGMNPGKPFATGGAAKHDDMTADKSMVAKGVHKHEAAMHKGKPMTKLSVGGPVDSPTEKGMLAEKGMQGGGGGAIGRMEKAKKYGK